MRVFPTAKRTHDHNVAEHTSGFASDMLGGPDLRDRADAYADFNTRAGMFDAACFFDDLGVFPGRSEARERVRQGVPAVNGFGGGGDAGAVDEKFRHGGLKRFDFLGRDGSLARSDGVDGI